MKRLLMLLVALVAMPTLAATYTYTGPLFSTITNHTTCTVGICADYSGSMRVTGFFTTAAPLASGLVGSNVTTLVTSYSFNDGVNTIASSDANARLYDVIVSTSGTGAITAWNFAVQRWTTNNPGPHVVNDRQNAIIIDSAVFDAAFNNAQCIDVTPQPPPVAADSCFASVTTTDGSSARASTIGAFALQVASSIAIPTLSAWNIMGLGALVMLCGLFRLRRSKRVSDRA